jgi:glycerol dehydrogenase
MKRILISPSKYVQGDGELNNLGTYLEDFSKRPLIISSKSCRKRVQEYLDEIIKDDSLDLIFGDFGKECTRDEIDSMVELAEKNHCGVIIGLGGGKSIDTAKAAAFLAKKPVIIVPTIASTDAPTSKLSVIYSKKGEFEEYFFQKKNPDLVLVDTAIIASAPTRYLVSGMGDALATYFEARSCLRSGADNIPGGKSTKAAYAIARTCFEILMNDSIKAKAACDENEVTEELENIVEANILLSGIGFESSGLAAAHSIHNGLTVLEEVHQLYHGEKVAFGVLVHLVLENAPNNETSRIISYCKSMGLPTCLKGLGIKNVTGQKIRAVSEAACSEGETIHNMPFPVTPEDVFKAIKEADILGK